MEGVHPWLVRWARRDSTRDFYPALAALRGYDMNGIFQMQGGKNWILPKELNANGFFWDSHWLEIWSNHFCPTMGPNGGSVAMDSVGQLSTNIFSLTVHFLNLCAPSPNNLGRQSCRAACL